jgi:hypothetical protein
LTLALEDDWFVAKVEADQALLEKPVISRKP